ncbi:MAG: hypothetical protein NT040_05665 [Bacteroidetes bacterium]|nr:hypothetical protein [Bacteroidota bacterium]
MKHLFLSLFIFLWATPCLLAQNPAGPDTLLKKSEGARIDSTVKTEAAATKQQEQPAKAHVRRDTRPLKDRINFDLPASFWVNPSQIFGEISILVSYRFPKILSIGTGPTYIFNYQRGANKYLNGFGGKVFVKAQLLKFLYAFTEYQGINNQYISNWTPVTVSKEYTDSWFVGAGFNIRLGRRSGINMSVLYDLLHDSHSPYNSATTYRFGFSF